MIKQLRLQHFRQHLDRTFDFGPGINTIRGENEAGKTTVLEAFAYLCFGARALRQSLDETVTYHQPVSKLRVEGIVEHLGVVYTAYRAKSGCEVTFGAERITGQTEVTKFFEQLFGADAAMAGKLMIANQKSLAESLTGGATAAGQMIEELANFSLIDEIVELVQAKLVSGVTTGAEARVATLREQVAAAAAPVDLAPLQESVERARQQMAGAEGAHAKQVADFNDIDVDAANAILADEKACQRVIETATLELSQLETKLRQEAPVAPAQAEIDAARAAVEAEKTYAAAAKVHAELVKAAIEGEWEGSMESLEAEIVATSTKVDAAQALADVAQSELHDLTAAEADLRRTSGVTAAQLEGRLIKETTCAFCDKDLTDVPEVVTRNSKLNDELVKLRSEVVTIQKGYDDQRTAARARRDAAIVERDEALAYLKDLQAVVQRHTKADLLYARAGDLITLDLNTVPATWTWAGPVISDTRPDVGSRLVALEQAARAAVAFEAARAQLVTQVNNLKVKRDAAVLSRNSLQIKEAYETLGDYDVAKLAVAETAAAARAAQDAHRDVVTALNYQRQANETAAAALELAKVNLAAAEKDLADTVANNVLIKKLKSARPVITDKLWSIVLAGVSDMFSQVRGEFTAITRADGAFKENGYPVAGLSGSAQDMLGLAIRISLTRTFLPGSDFLVLDEPAAACSDARETEMLGMLSTLGFGQIIMVTHSDLSDAFSDKVIVV